MENLIKVILCTMMGIIIVSFLVPLLKVLGILIVPLVVCLYCHQKGYFRLNQP
ncbi:hypothetical protein [Streptococcus pluranimalium]|uniref:hypothetical protein n=1 Tax=Streptococcus pluranimalium TaxID=82348 RepID=UPI0039FD3384